MSSSVALEVVLVDRRDELLELAVRGEHERRRRDLVEVADLEADDPVLDVVDDPGPVAGADLGGPLEQLDEPEPLAVDRHRAAGLEADPDELGLVGRILGRRDELEDVVGRWARSRSSIERPSEERPQRLSSIEYGAAASFAPLIGIPCSRA